MKKYSIYAATMFLALVFMGCNENSEEEKDTKKKETKETVEETEAETDEENTADREKEEKPDVPKVELEDRTYSIEEFNKLYSENAAGLEGQEIVLEGFYLNHNKQKATGEEEFEYNVTLYKDKSCDRDDDRAFFMMESKDADQFKGIKQYQKISVKGTISGDEFFDAPKLNGGVVVKK